MFGDFIADLFELQGLVLMVAVNFKIVDISLMSCKHVDILLSVISFEISKLFDDTFETTS